jgi:hypothetical protein
VAKPPPRAGAGCVAWNNKRVKRRAAAAARKLPER